MSRDILAALPTRSGHYVLESGYHTDLWITLDALFVDPTAVAPLVSALAERLRPHRVTGICGPMVGGAFLAQALAVELGVCFYYTEPVTSPANGLFKAEYRLPSALTDRVRGERLAVVDDVISAGSSVRATIAGLTTAGASTVVVASLLVLGVEAINHLAKHDVPLETLERRDFSLWAPSECPLCVEGVMLENRRAGLHLPSR